MLSRTRKPVRARPNTEPQYVTADPTGPKLNPSPSPLSVDSWAAALRGYPGNLPSIIHNILTFGARIGYTGSQKLMLSKNLTSADEDPATITTQLRKDLDLQRVSTHSGASPFYSSPLGLVPKADGGWRRIHHLSYPYGDSVNDWIPEPYGNMAYTTIEDVFELVRRAGPGALLVKKDLKDGFRVIPVALGERWLLGFLWEGHHYHENCLPFGLRTAPFLFNLLAEALHWILQSLLHWEGLAHYLDDFILVLPLPDDASYTLRRINDDYNALTNVLGLLRNDSKDAAGTAIEALGIEIDSVTMSARLSSRKLAKAMRLVSEALTKGHLTQLEVQKLAGYLSFCSSVVRLGRTYLRRLWDFMGTFIKPHSLRPLTVGAEADLFWWKDLLPHLNGIRLLEDANRVVHHLFTDASSQGMGAFWYTGNNAQGDWRQFSMGIPSSNAFSYRFEPAEGTLHINAAEILAVQLSFQR
jgi:hypothetical protein